MGNFVENIKLFTSCPALNSKDNNGLDMYKDSLSTLYQTKP